ncbi:MAG: hypothetical protein INR73_20995 [Williamsia sp.]|nr:hypothetical protein [Williamsia sp.]
MKLRSIFIFILLSGFCRLQAQQKPDSIFFHLYTDSLKKGTYNYINVDGKMHDGSWLPLTEAQLSFTTTGGRFERNSLLLDLDFTQEKVLITATLKSDTAISKSITIWIKKGVDTEKPRTKEEIDREIGQPRQRRKGT